MVIVYAMLNAVFFLLICIIVLWAGNMLFRRKLTKKQTEIIWCKFKERLMNPDFKSVENHFGHPLPKALYDLYHNKEELFKKEFSVAPTMETPDHFSYHIAFYEPCDKEAINVTWPGIEKYFRIADDGCGNSYLIDPKQDNPAVVFYDHETEEITGVCNSLSEFLRWPRKEHSYK